MWTYTQKPGEMIQDDGDLLGYGYSGALPDGKNNPAMQNVPDVGPIPCGLWRIGTPYDDPEVGPFALALTPEPGTETFGRTLFRIHGDAIEKARQGNASKGCIVMSRANREAIASSGDRKLLVTSGL